MKGCAREQTGVVQCLAAVILGLSCLPVRAVDFPLSWAWANPTPHGNNIIDIACQNQFWVQVAELGQMYTSTDLQLWTPVTTQTTRNLRAVTFFNGSIVVSGENGTILAGPTVSNLTVIDLGTSDWLEGVAASPQVAVAVGDNGAIYTSTDALTWRRQSPPFTQWLRSIAYGTPTSSGLFVAVGEAGFVATSSNGTQWQAQSSIGSADLNRVAWSGSEFWILGDSGTAFQSSSGKNWQAANSGATNTLNAFASLQTTRLIAGDDEVRLRIGKSAWSDETSALKPFPPPAWTYLSATTTTNVAATTNLTNFASAYLLCGRTGMMVEGLVTTNNSTNVWFGLSDSLWNWLWDVKRFPNLFLAVGDRATLLSSSDGFAWDAELPPDTATNSIFLGIGGRTNLAVAVGSAGTIIASPDSLQSVVSTNADGSLTTNQVNTLGIYWQGVTPAPTTQDLQGVTTFGQLIVVSGGGGTVLTSLDGTNWVARSTPTSAFLSSLESFPGGLVAVGKDGTILTSPDAVAWTQHPQGTTNWIYRVRYLNGGLMAVGQNGTVLTSDTGSQWRSQSSGTSAWLNDVQYLGNLYFAVGDQGTVLSSPDAVSWTPRGTITGKSIFGAASYDGMLVLVGIEGIVLRSQVVPIDPTIAFLKFPVTPDQKTFLFSGHPGQQFTLDLSSDVRSWSVGPILRIDSSGTVPFTDSRTNSPLHQYFRAVPKF